MSQPDFITVLSVQVGKPRTIVSETEREWITGFFKEPAQGSVRVTTTNLEGDGQADLRVHGGPEKAINVYASEHYAYWRDLLGIEDFPFGAFGENLTTSGAVEAGVCIGDIFEGEGPDPVSLQISQPRQPCWKLSRRWNIKDLSARVERNGKTGWYFRVLREGSLQAGMPLKLISRPHPEWTVVLANEIMHHRKDDLAAAAALAQCLALSISWKESLSRRAGGSSPDTSPRLNGPGEKS
jgi:MOSC domain-containing protein YiiM